MTKLFALALALALAAAAVQDDLDSDGDGLSDFHEVHKHRTDPHSADSDGDGVPDGDWDERREFTYVVRTVVHVMRPVTPEHLTGDFQDARVLRELGDRIELEVLHYPFSTAPEALRGDAGRRTAADDPALVRWLEPGPTSDWDEDLRERIREELAREGIDLDAMDDRELVESVSAWLLGRASFDDSFTTFVTGFDEDGRPFVPDDLVPHLEGGAPPTAKEWAREISARGMFEHRTRGSCTSSAIYLSGCLRAVGIPTRTVLGIPLFDANDESQWEMVREGIRQPVVRRKVLAAMEGQRGSWTSHTFNEVWLGGRWWRLDYQELGVGILRSDRFGLLTHVATFHDWADARAHETIGRRQTLGERDEVLGGRNPYALLAVEDQVGEHCTLELPEDEPPLVEALTWTDDPSLPDDVREGIERSGRFGLLARLTGVEGASDLRALLDAADLRVLLETDGRPLLWIAFDPGCWWLRRDHALVYLPFRPADRRDLALGAEYRPRARNAREDARIEFAPDVVVVRRGEVPEHEPPAALLEELRWTDDPGLPDDVREGIASSGRFGLLASLTGVDGPSGLRELLDAADLHVFLEDERRPALDVALDAGCWWWRGEHALVYLPLGPAVRRDLAPGAEYRPHPRNAKEGPWIDVARDARVVRREAFRLGTALVEELTWTDDPALPADVREGITRSGRFGLLARVTPLARGDDPRELLEVADLRVFLEAEDHPTLGIALDPGFSWGRGDHVLVSLPFGPADRRDLVPGVEYRPRARNESTSARIEIAPEVLVVRSE